MFQSAHRRLTALSVLCLAIGTSNSALADPVGFTNLTNNSGMAPTVAGQFSVNVMMGSSATHTFVFGNVGAIPSTIGQIYIDTGSGPIYLTTTGIGNGPGVSFAVPPGGIGPNNLPAGGSAVPPFTTDAAFKRNSGPGGIGNGVDTGETVSWQILFDSGFDAHTALHSGDLRFGLHVQRIDGGESDNFVSPGPGGGPPPPDPGPGPTPDPVPEPASIMMWLILAAAAFGSYRRQRARCVAA